MGAVCVAGRTVPCIDLPRAHSAKLDLCSALEAIAITMSAADMDRLGCLRIASDLLPLLRLSHRYEEGTIFPAFARACGDDPVLARLRSDHLADQWIAEDLTLLLLQTGHGQPMADPDASRSLVRRFVESVRSHVALERAHILAAATEDRAGGGAAPLAR